jgi:hypothetical protein
MDMFLQCVGFAACVVLGSGTLYAIGLFVEYVFNLHSHIRILQKHIDRLDGRIDAMRETPK